jgi:hypothetical protein
MQLSGERNRHSYPLKTLVRTGPVWFGRFWIIAANMPDAVFNDHQNGRTVLRTIGARARAG